MTTKYPRTFHLPWSPGATSDDKKMHSVQSFEGEEIVVTVKMDGENTSLYRDAIHARSTSSHSHPSRDWVKRLHAQLCNDIPTGFRVCGENLYARHSIAYGELPQFFLVFNIWDGSRCLSWDDTLLWTALLGLETVPVVYRGVWQGEAHLNRLNGLLCGQEGYVVRVARAFERSEFKNVVGKWVRAGHVTTDEHWMYRSVQPNRIRGGSE